MEMEYGYIHLFVLWLNILGTVILVGAVVFRSTVLAPVLRTLDASSPERENVVAECQRYFKRWMAACLILLVFVNIPDLILRAQMMSRKPLSEVVPIIPLVLFRTHIGKVWLFREGLLAGFAILWFFIKDKPRAVLQALFLLGVACLCLSLTLSGHAADKGDFSLPVLFDWLHLFNVSIWLGGLVPLRLLTPKILNGLEKRSHFMIEAAILERFSSVAISCIGVLVLCGSYLAWLRIRTLSTLVSTPYGITLLFKITFFLPLLALGAIIRYYIRPSLQNLAGKPMIKSWAERSIKAVISRLGGGLVGSDFRLLQLRFRTEQMALIHLKLLVSVQCIIAVLTLALASSLTQTSPPNLQKMNPEGSTEMHQMAN